MKPIAFAALAAALAGCAASSSVIDLRRPLVDCLREGKLLGAVKVDTSGAIIDRACLAIRIERRS